MAKHTPVRHKGLIYNMQRALEGTSDRPAIVRTAVLDSFAVPIQFFNLRVCSDEQGFCKAA